MSQKKSAPTPDASPSVKLSPRGAARLNDGHVWVYRSDIAVAKEVPPGSLVHVTDVRGKFLGTALYSSSSQIAIRMISREEVRDLPALVADRIRAAIAYRKGIVSGTDAWRVVFSEGDFLPGLIVDRYADVLVLQSLTAGSEYWKDTLADLLLELTGLKAQALHALKFTYDIVYVK